MKTDQDHQPNRRQRQRQRFSTTSVSTVTYQIEFSDNGTESWQQMAPIVTSIEDASTLFAAETIKAKAAGITRRFRIIRTERTVIT